MFDPPTRIGIQRITIGFGAGAGGPRHDINNAIGAFLRCCATCGRWPPTWPRRTTNLGGFFRSLENYTGALVPVAQTQGQLFANLDTTFRALAGVAVPFLQETISDTPPMFDATIANAPVIRPFLTDTASLFSELRPGIATLPQSAPVLAQRLRDRHAQPARHRRPGPAHGHAGQEHRRLRPEPAVQQGLDRLTLTLLTAGAAAGVHHARPVDLQLRDAVPAQHPEPAVRARQPGRAAALRPDRHRRRARL